VKKKYVKIIAQFCLEGKLTPLEILWEDGRRFEITHVGSIQRAASSVGGAGYRFEITVDGKKRNLYLEDVKLDKTIGARFFLEVPS